MNTLSHGTPILQVRRNRANPDEFEAFGIMAGTYIVKETTVLRKDLISFLKTQVFGYPSREELLRELERKGSATAQVKVKWKGDAD